MINVENLTRRYGDFTAVDDVSFSISHGEIVGLLGHNGAGKTTILKMLTGYLEPTAGRIEIDGIDIRYDRQKTQSKIGYLPENCPVYPEMTAVGYLEYSAALHNIAEEERGKCILEALDRAALTDKACLPISSLSRGYRQRTGVAQAILHNPRILILDEPTNGLDPTQILQMRRLIKELAHDSTIIISTHILQEVQAVCDRVIIVKSGSIALDKRLETLQTERRLYIHTSGTPDKAVDLFQGCDGVSSVVEVAGKNAADHLYSLSLESSTNKKDQAASLASMIHEHGWELYAMNFEKRDLEHVFSEISGQ